MNKMKDFIEDLRNEKGYSWICKHGYELNKSELVNIIKEYDYAIHANSLVYDSKDMYDSIADELEELYSYEGEE